ncbi:helix-turn-helix domain-containing protein [Nioella sp.]|uniref:helix-turn-helix domain-containing protein n=1 Tax=Nioella sp. TaxID=1912091 RepID=UPI00351447A9
MSARAAPDPPGAGKAWQAEINGTFGLWFSITSKETPVRPDAISNRVDWHARTRTAHLAKLVFAAHTTEQLAGRGRNMRFPVLISHLTDGTCRFEQAGRKDQADAGDMYLIDTGQPFRIATTRMSTLAILVDRNAIRAHFPPFERFGAGVLRAADHAGEVAGNIARDVFEAAQAGADRTDRLVECLCQFLNYALPLAAPPEASDARLAAAMALARDRMGDPDLRLDDLARAAGISVRQLNLLFAETGHSPMRWLKNERLDAVARDLCADATTPGTARRISDIAEARGFRDSAHLSTTFRQRFSMSPRAYRAQRQAGRGNPQDLMKPGS